MTFAFGCTTASRFGPALNERAESSGALCKNQKVHRLNESLYWIARSTCRYYSLVRSTAATRSGSQGENFE